MLAAFIREQSDAIVLHWTTVPSAEPGVSRGAGLSRCRPEVEALLNSVAEYVQGGEMRQAQSACEAASLGVCAERYAASHLTSGLTEVQLVLTFQSLRKIVLQLWAESLGDSDVQTLPAAIRVNQAFDNALTAAMDHYCRIKDRCHGLFLKTLAHDLRNPLGGIELTVQMMQQNTPNALGGIDKIASSICRSVDNAARIADDMVDVGNMREGLGIVVNPVKLDAAAFCRRLVDKIMSRYPGQAILIEANDPVMGLIDESRIAQAFFNVIGYASCHASRKEPVTAKLQAASGSVVLTVRYYPDMPALDDVEAMFAPMRNYAAHVLSKKGPISELGVGLFIAREIIIAHEGEMTAVAEDGWMTLEARLPCTADAGR
jgi:signal transduction histidine kinase